jgi:hypothetical protein
MHVLETMPLACRVSTLLFPIHLLCPTPLLPPTYQARRYVARWVAASDAGSGFTAYTGMKEFTFDVLVNQVGHPGSHRPVAKGWGHKLGGMRMRRSGASGGRRSPPPSHGPSP